VRWIFRVDIKQRAKKKAGWSRNQSNILASSGKSKKWKLRWWSVSSTRVCVYFRFWCVVSLKKSNHLNIEMELEDFFHHVDDTFALERQGRRGGGERWSEGRYIQTILRLTRTNITNIKPKEHNGVLCAIEKKMDDTAVWRNKIFWTRTRLRLKWVFAGKGDRAHLNCFLHLPPLQFLFCPDFPRMQWTRG